MTPHNEANKNDIAKIVIMPGDPLRAKYIAENFLTDYRLVNKVRAMYAYTGKYKGKEITIMGHGMGMPSAGIYTYELYRHYDVDSIIRIGSCGAYVPSLNLFDVILADQVYTESNYALTMNNEDCHLIHSADQKTFLARLPKDLNIIAAEMEAFAIFYNAKILNKKAACLMSVVDSEFKDEVVTAEDRQLGLNKMIQIALESTLHL